MKLDTLPEAVLFDLDGTLLDNSAVVADAYYTGMEKLGYEPKNKEFIKTLFGKSTYDTGRGLGLREEDLPKIDAHFWDYFGSYAQKLEGSPVVYDGVPETLELISSKNIPIGVCTSNQASSAKTLLQKAGLSKHFHAYVGSEDLEERKPSPKPLLLTLSRLGISHKENVTNDNIWFIGDSAPDVLAARNAGIRSIAIPEHINLDSVKATKPDHLFSSMKDFYSDLTSI